MRITVISLRPLSYSRPWPRFLEFLLLSRREICVDLFECSLDANTEFFNIFDAQFLNHVSIDTLESLCGRESLPPLALGLTWARRHDAAWRVARHVLDDMRNWDYLWLEGYGGYDYLALTMRLLIDLSHLLLDARETEGARLFLADAEKFEMYLQLSRRSPRF